MKNVRLKIGDRTIETVPLEYDSNRVMMKLTNKAKKMIAKNKIELEKEGVIYPYINNEYYCKTCGNKGKSHPVTSFCFDCGDDNWQMIDL